MPWRKSSERSLVRRSSWEPETLCTARNVNPGLFRISELLEMRQHCANGELSLQ
jgi:hypothetical protein